MFGLVLIRNQAFRHGFTVEGGAAIFHDKVVSVLPLEDKFSY